jgi:hypothetical protein
LGRVKSSGKPDESGKPDIKSRCDYIKIPQFGLRDKRKEDQIIASDEAKIFLTFKVTDGC